MYCINRITTSAGRLLVPEGIIHPVVSASALTWFIRYMYIYYASACDKICEGLVLTLRLLPCSNLWHFNGLFRRLVFDSSLISSWKCVLIILSITPVFGGHNSIEMQQFWDLTMFLFITLDQLFPSSYQTIYIVDNQMSNTDSCRPHKGVIFGGACVANFIIFLCCHIMCLYILSSVSVWCPLPFLHKTMFGSSLPPVVCRRAHVCI
jgi:hypothetical protein